MKNIYGIAITIISIALLSIFGGMLASNNMQIQNAREFHDSIVERIQASHYSNYVISDCKTKASQNGYALEVKKLSVYEDKEDYYVGLKYTISFPLIGKTTNGIIEGYAR